MLAASFLLLALINTAPEEAIPLRRVDFLVMLACGPRLVPTSLPEQSCAGMGMLGRRLVARVLPPTHELNDRWQQGNAHNRDDDQMKVTLHYFTFTETESCQYEGCYPRRPTSDAVANKTAKTHLRDSGDEWRERPQYRRESSDDDRLASVSFVERLRSEEVFLVQ